MDPKDHKRLADNAFMKALEMFEKEDYSMDLLDFAHGARLHYHFSSSDKYDIEVIKNIEKSEKLLKNIYSKIDVESLL